MSAHSVVWDWQRDKGHTRSAVLLLEAMMPLTEVEKRSLEITKCERELRHISEVMDELMQEFTNEQRRLFTAAVRSTDRPGSPRSPKNSHRVE